MPKKSEIQSALFSEELPVEVRAIFLDIVRSLREKKSKWSGHLDLAGGDRRRARLKVRGGGGTVIEIIYWTGSPIFHVGHSRIPMADPKCLEKIYNKIAEAVDDHIEYAKKALNELEELRIAVTV